MKKCATVSNESPEFDYFSCAGVKSPTGLFYEKLADVSIMRIIDNAW